MPDGNGKFAELGLEGVAPFEGVDDMTAQDVPHGDAEFSRHRDGGPPEADCAPAGRPRSGPIIAAG